MGAHEDWPALIPELQVSNLSRSLAFYRDAGFKVAYSRAEEEFVMLRHGSAALMLEAIDGPGRRIGSRDLNHPLGHGMNFQIEVQDVVGIYARLQQGG